MIPQIYAALIGWCVIDSRHGVTIEATRWRGGKVISKAQVALHSGKERPSRRKKPNEAAVSTLAVLVPGLMPSILVSLSVHAHACTEQYIQGMGIRLGME